MRDVFVDGIKYVPVSNDRTIQNLRKSLDENLPYITRSVKDEIITDFKRNSSEKVNFGRDDLSYDKHLFKKDNIKRIDDMGHVYFKRGGRERSVWSINQLMEIQTHYINGTLTNDSIKQFEEMWNLNHNVVCRMVCDVKSGYCDKLINKWKSMNKKVYEPQNNPQKRREMGWF